MEFRHVYHGQSRPRESFGSAVNEMLTGLATEALASGISRGGEAEIRKSFKVRALQDDSRSSSG